MKKYVTLYTGTDDNSYFREDDPGVETKQPLGSYSKKFLTTSLMFRTFLAGAKYDWHNAPQPQYIVYLEGKVEVEVSSGEKKIFNPGDVLFATDLKGKGHITRTLTNGRSIIITTQDDKKNQEIHNIRPKF